MYALQTPGLVEMVLQPTSSFPVSNLLQRREAELTTEGNFKFLLTWLTLTLVRQGRTQHKANTAWWPMHEKRKSLVGST